MSCPFPCTPRLGLRMLGVVLFAALLLAGPTALADDGGSRATEDGSAVSRLTPAERAYLEKKFPEWSQVDPRRQEHIARNVIRLREMSEEDRKKLKERIARIRGRARSKGGRGHSRSGGFRAINAIGSRLVDRLPPAAKAEVERVDGRPSGVKMTLFHLVRGKVAATEGHDFPAEELAALPEAMRQKINRALAQAKDETDPRRAAAARSKLSHMRAFQRIESIRKQLGADATDAQFADAVMATWAGEVDAVMAEIEADPKRFGEMLERKMRHASSPQDHARSVRWLEQVALRKWRRDPEARAAADKVVRRLLVDELGIKPEALADLPGYDRPRERIRAIDKLLGSVPGGARGNRGWSRGKGRDGSSRRRAGGEAPRRGGSGRREARDDGR